MSGGTSGEDRQRELLGGRYRLVERLARGGTASVWRGEDARLGRPVAIKILDVDDSGRHREEAQTLARLSHPHIANVYDVGESDGHPYLVIELAEGRSLAALLAEYEVAWPAAVACCAQVASALAAAHARGLVHRDVKPSNIMLTSAGVKLIDFGISASDGERESDPDGHVRGTPAYTAPERLTADTVAPAADIYSLGVVLFRSLAGRLPERPVTADQPRTAQRIAAALPDDVPAEVVDACLRCLDADPTRRPIAERLARLLRAAVPPGVDVAALSAAASTVAQPADSNPTRPMRLARGLRLAAVMIGLLVLAVLAWTATGWGLGSGPVRTYEAAPVPPVDAAGCAVTYRVQSDSAGRFVAAITAEPGDTQPAAGWRLSVQLPDDATARPTGGWQADGDVLTSPAQPPLADGESAHLTLAGRRTAPGDPLALPTEVHLNGQACDVSAEGSIISPVRAAEPAPPTALVPGSAPGPGNVPAAKGHGKPDRDPPDAAANGRGRPAGGR
jgi:serine/threonine-protein kinase